MQFAEIESTAENICNPEVGIVVLGWLSIWRLLKATLSLSGLIERNPAPSLRQLRQLRCVRCDGLLVLRLPVLLRFFAGGGELAELLFLPASAAFGEDAGEQGRRWFRGRMLLPPFGGQRAFHR